MRLKREFYLRSDVVVIAQELIGKVLCTNINGQLTSGIISETEAYCGRNDKACHANNNVRTSRTEIMYEKGGHAYVYLCYGIHHLFNVVTNRVGLADAVLIRGVEPLEGKDTMIERRRTNKNLSNGPGKLTKALGISLDHYGLDLLGDTIWIEDRGLLIKPEQIKNSKRIGIEYAMEDAEKMWRFYID